MATLHSHPVFTALTVEPYAIDDDQFEADTPQRAAKRRRIEGVANQYLDGSAPFIQTAALRGPFNAKWQNPWAKRRPQSRNTSSRPAASAAAARRQELQPTREVSSRTNPIDRQHRRPTYREPPAVNPRQREYQARAETERVEAERKKAKDERREQRRQLQKKREEKGAELRKDGLGKSPDRPVDLTAGADPQNDAEDIARSRDYGSREIRSSFTDEWLSRLGSPAPASARTPEMSPVHMPEMGKQPDLLGPPTPTRQPRKRPGINQQGTTAKLEPKSRSERHRSLVPERRPRGAVENGNPSFSSFVRHSNIVAKDCPQKSSLPPPDAASTSARPQDPPLQQPFASKVNRSKRSHEPGSAFKSTTDETGVPSSLHVNVKEGSLPRPVFSNNKEAPKTTREDIPSATAASPAKADSGYDGPFDGTPVRQPYQKDRRHPSGFTPINQRFSSQAAGHPEPVVSTTPAGRPVLGVRSTTNNANPADGMRPSLHRGGEGVIVMAAGDVRYDEDSFHAVGRALEGQENSILKSAENKISAHSPLKGAIVQSTEKRISSTLINPKKSKRTHPLHASPTTTNSPGFAYRKLTDPMENIPKLQPTSQLTKRTVAQKRRARLMTFESLPMEQSEMPNPEPHTVDPVAAGTGINGKVQDDSTTGEQKNNDGQISSTRDLSTQAAILYAQQDFHQQFRSPAKEVPRSSPEKIASSQARTSTPPPSQPPVEITAVTPFNDFNKGQLFMAENHPKLAPPPVSTQELLNGASPYIFSTVKKNMKKRKRVSLAASPLKFTEATSPEKPTREEDLAAQIGVEGDTTITEIALVDKSTTPPTPKFLSFSREQPSSGLKPHSSNPTLASSFKFNPSRFISGTRGASQSSQSFSRPTQPSSSAPVPTASSHALRQEYRRAQFQTQSRSQSLSQGQSQSESPQRSSLQQAQRQAGLDDVDLDSAMDAADSFLDSWNLGLDERRGPSGR